MVQTRTRRTTRSSSQAEEEEHGVAPDQVTNDIDGMVADDGHEDSAHDDVGKQAAPDEAAEITQVDDTSPHIDVAPEDVAVGEDGEKQDVDETMDGANQEQLLPVLDTTEATGNDATPPSSDEEGVVQDDTARPAKRARAKPTEYHPKPQHDGDDDDDDDDELVKIERELEGSRYDGIDVGTKKRLAIILEYSKVRPAHMEDKLIQQLKELTKAQAKELMVLLDQSMRTSKIRNFSGYVSSMIRRMLSNKLLTGPRETTHTIRGTMQDIQPEAREILQDLIDSRLVRRGDLEGKPLNILSDKPKDVQVLIMQQFSGKNLRSVRNMAAYFMATIREVDQGLRSGKLRIGGGKDTRRPSERREYRHEEDKPHYDYVPRSQRQAQAYPPPQYNHIQEGLIQPTSIPNAMSAREMPAKHYALEQVQWGVRVDEFQALSPHAKYVHAAAALRLQQLWDLEQNKLVSVLDDNSWLLLAGLDAPNGVKVVNEVSERMKTAGDDLITVNRIFVEVASKYPRREDAPPLPNALSQPLSTSLLSSMQATTFSNPVFDPRGGMYSKPDVVNLPGPAGTLPQRIQAKIDDILGNPNWLGKVTLDTFDDRLVGILRGDEDQAFAVLDEFNRSDPSKVRNPSAFLFGCVRNAFNMNPNGARGRPSSGRGRGRGNHRYNPY